MQQTIHDDIIKAYTRWQQAMQKAAKTEDEKIFIWTDHEGLTYEHLPLPEPISETLPHLDAFHQYWIAQKKNPGFKLGIMTNGQHLNDEQIQADFHWLSSHSMPAEHMDNEKLWIEQSVASSPALNKATYVLNPYFGIVRDGISTSIAEFVNDALQYKTHYWLVDVAAFHQSGAPPTWEIAIALAMIDELLSATHDDVLKQQIGRHLLIKTGVGVMQLLEIAKLRALRFSIYNLLGHFFENAPYSQILAESSLVYFSYQDTEINLIRHASEAISAVAGGADMVIIHPHNRQYHDIDAQRLSANTLHLLREEAHMDKVIDPYAGSYYLEKQTDTLAKHAWEHFKQIVDSGGFIEAMKNGLIQNEIKQHRNKLYELFKNNEIIGIGVNKYPSPMAKSVIPPDVPKSQNGTIEAIHPFNLFQ